MNSDLKMIKKKYGEKMAHFCREYFPTILKKVGDAFLSSNRLLEEVNLPSLENVGMSFLANHPTLNYVSVQDVKRKGK